MSDIFIDVYFNDDEGEEASDCIAEYEHLDWADIEYTIADTIAEGGDFPLEMVEKIDIYSESVGSVLKIYRKPDLVELLAVGFHKCNSIWR